MTLQRFNNLYSIGHIRQPIEVAEVIAFLMFDRSPWITGATWNVDGGVMAGRNS